MLSNIPGCACDPMGCSPPGSSVHGILQARILEWVVIPSSKGSSQPREGTLVSYIEGNFFFFYCLSHQGSLCLPTSNQNPSARHVCVCLNSHCDYSSASQEGPQLPVNQWVSTDTWIVMSVTAQYGSCRGEKCSSILLRALGVKSVLSKTE